MRMKSHRLKQGWFRLAIKIILLRKKMRMFSTVSHTGGLQLPGAAEAPQGSTRTWLGRAFLTVPAGEQGQTQGSRVGHRAAGWSELGFGHCPGDSNGPRLGWHTDTGVPSLAGLGGIWGLSLHPWGRD